MESSGKSLSIVFACLFTASMLAACGGGGSSSSSSGTGGTVTGITITGSAKISVAGKPGQNGGQPHYAAMPNATITLYKVFPDGTRTAVDIGTVTSDATGAFTIPDVAIPTTGTGAATDYFYEISATDGTNTVTYPLAPTADATVEMTPATTLAATILSDVVDNPNSADNPTPTATAINAVAELVGQDVATNLDTKTTLPTATANDSSITAASNGVTTAGGAAEAAYRALQFESEYAGFAADLTAASATDVAGYLMRVARESCGSQNSPLYTGVAEALAASLTAGTTYTPDDIAAAFNTVATQPNQVSAATKTTAYAALLTAIEANPASFTQGQLTALYTRRTLTGAAFTSTTALKADQALSFLLSLGENGGQVCQFQNTNFSHVVAALTAHTMFGSPFIMDYQVYNDSTGACNGGAGEAHFAADDVRVFIPKASSATVTGVTIASTAAAFNGGAAATLSLNGDRYTYSGAALCVTANSSVDYTITATLSDSTTAAKTITRQHDIVPEPTTYQADGVQLTNNENTPLTVAVARPLITWDAPATLYASVTTPPAGSEVKYTVEFSHYKVGSGGPIASDYASCPGFNTGGARKLYSVDNFILPVDCDPAACKTAQVAAGDATNADTFECRMYINAWLVDKNDKLLGQAAGTFGFFTP